MSNTAPPVAIKAAQALATSLALSSLMLLAAVIRGVLLVLSPDSQALFEQNASGSTNSAAYSVILGYGVPVVAFGVLYGLVALRITRGRRWTWLLGVALSLVGVVLCVTTVSKLLSYAALVLGAFQVALALLLLAGARYFWASSSAADSVASSVEPEASS